MLALLWADLPPRSLTSPWSKHHLCSKILCMVLQAEIFGQPQNYSTLKVFWSAGNRNKMVKLFPTGSACLRACTSADVDLFFRTRQTLRPRYGKDWCSCITPVHFLLQSTPLPRNRGQKWYQVCCNCKNYRNVGYRALLLLFPHSYTEEAAKHFTQASDKLKTGCRKDQRPQMTT